MDRHNHFAFQETGQGDDANAGRPRAVGTPDDDAVALKGKANVGAELYVAIAKLYEQSNRLPEAEQQYQLALKDRPDDLPALLGYARLKEYVGKPNEALQLYQRAVKAHPQQASAHNNLGLFYARQERLDEAAAAMERAVQIEPKNALYRNNIATVLVEQGKSRDAMRHLREVHEPAAAYYNLGYLLNKKGQTQGAMQSFAMALKADPSMEPARRWLDYLQHSTAQARLPQQPLAGPSVSVDESAGRLPRLSNDRTATPNVDSRPIMLPPPPEMQPQDLPLPETPTARRLPPTSLRNPAMDSPRPMSYDHSSAPDAPLPPASSNPAIRPLPRVN